ncbi:hypothetical protein [Deinococcus maricopensis]|uniref:hypothetical protein n=1 Tax=Deinococcus maricopensis TaxID=309887 RepID=UPI0011D190ED|nr:hypothetical protein [Deinococcus maricopensis]
MNDFDYQSTIDLLSSKDELTFREKALLGVSLFRTARFEECEPYLLEAHQHGEIEASVEYGNLLRVRGRTVEAIEHLQQVLPRTSGLHHYACLRWLGAALYQGGRHEDALERLSSALHGYETAQLPQIALRVRVMISSIYFASGQHGQAKAIIDQSLLPLEQASDKLPYLSAMYNLLNIELETGNVEKAEELIRLLHAGARDLGSPRMLLYAKIGQSQLHLILGSYQDYFALLEDIRHEALQLGEYQMIEWATLRLADHHSVSGHHAEAIKLLLDLNQQYPHKSMETRLLEALMARRRGDLLGALRRFREVASLAEAAQSRYTSVRAQLHIAYVHYLLNDFKACGHDLLPAIEGLLEIAGGRGPTSIRPELEELSELLYYASLQPEMAPYLPSVMEHLADLSGAMPADVFAPSSTLELLTLGQQSALKNGVPVSFSVAGVVPVLVYLALHPGSTRGDVQAALFPDREPESAGAYVRKCLQAIREGLGGDVLLSEGPYRAPRYTLSRKVAVTLDSQRALKFASEGNVAGALAAYRGEFLPGFSGSEWVDGMRDRVRTTLLLTLERLIGEAEAAHEWSRVVLLGNQALRVDPYAVEIAERRLRAARIVSSPAELAAYVAEWNRLTN